MNTIETYNKVFCTTFKINEDQLAGLKYQDTALWDSIGHMTLVAAIEEVFDIMLETDDIIDLSSYEKGIDILTKNYDLRF